MHNGLRGSLPSRRRALWWHLAILSILPLEAKLSHVHAHRCPNCVPTWAEADTEAKGKIYGVAARGAALTRAFNYLGLPVLSVPIGVDGNGMPVGAQLVGKPLAEGRLLAMADVMS